MRKRIGVLSFLAFISIIACQFTTLPTNTIQPTRLTNEIAPSEVVHTKEALLPTHTIPAVTPTENEPIAEGELFGAEAREHIRMLSEEIGQRIAGGPDELRSAQYIQKTFSDMGYETSVQKFDFDEEEGDVFDPDATNEYPSSQNIIAYKPGDSDRAIIVGAHYDSIDIGQGADDNASGVGVLLEAADRLADLETPYTILFIAFGAEEIDLCGSYYYVEQMSAADIANTIVMINLDSMAVGDFLYVYGSADGKLRDWVLDYAEQNNLPLQTQNGIDTGYPAGTTGDWSDHYPFEEAGIEYAYFEATNWELGDLEDDMEVDPQYGDHGSILHTEYDRLAYFDETFPGRVDERLDVFTRTLVYILTNYSAD